MRIAINTRLLLPHRLDGIGWFTYETCRRMVLQHPEHEFFFLFDRTPDPQFLFADNVKPVVLFPQARHPFLWMVYFDISLPWVLKKYHINLFLSTDGWMSLRTKVPTLDVIHDLNFEHSPGYLKPTYQWYMTRFFPRFAQKARRIATVSEFSKKDIADTYHIDPNKIDVVYDGAHCDYKPCSPDEKIAIRGRYTQGNPYFIFIGTISKRKNLGNMLRAFDQFKRDDRHSTKFVVVGATMFGKGEISDIYRSLRYKEDVIFLGRVEAQELARLLGAAEALLFASLFEGFGIPILEAFMAETPVITSNVTSMPEIAGDAALIVNPTSIGEIAQAMTSIMQKPHLADELIALGREQRQHFSWDRTAALLWESLMKTR